MKRWLILIAFCCVVTASYGDNNSSNDRSSDNERLARSTPDTTSATNPNATFVGDLAKTPPSEFDEFEFLKEVEFVTVTQVYLLDHPEGVPDGALVSPKPTSKLAKFVDGVDEPVIWVFPGTVDELTTFRRWLIGLPQRTGAMEFKVPANLVQCPGGLKLLFSKTQKIVPYSADVEIRDVKHYTLNPIPLADFASVANNAPDLTSDALKGLLNATDVLVGRAVPEILEFAADALEIFVIETSKGAYFVLVFDERAYPSNVEEPPELAGTHAPAPPEPLEPTESPQIAEQVGSNESTNNSRSGISGIRLVAGILIVAWVLLGAWMAFAQKGAPKSETATSEST